MIRLMEKTMMNKIEIIKGDITVLECRCQYETMSETPFKILFHVTFSKQFRM